MITGIDNSMSRTNVIPKLQYVTLTLSLLLICAIVAANQYYNQNKITEDLHTACKDFAISSEGMFKALCIKSTSLAPVRRTIELDEHIGNDPQKNELKWGGTNFSDKCDSLSVTVHSEGVKLKGYCDRSDAALGIRAGSGSSWKEWKELELNDGIKSDSTERGILKRR